MSWLGYEVMVFAYAGISAYSAIILKRIIFKI
jgi:hypothetical protein